MLLDMVAPRVLGHRGRGNAHKCSDDDDDKGRDKSEWMGARLSKTLISLKTSEFLIDGDDVDVPRPLRSATTIFTRL